MNWRACFPVVPGMDDIYPNLVFYPCPGDLTGYEALAAYPGRAATALSGAVRSLAAAGSDHLRGQAAATLPTPEHALVPPLARKPGGRSSPAATGLPPRAPNLTWIP